MTNTAGCDSVVTLDLTITTIDVTITSNGSVLTASINGATYQWINCSDNSEVSGATGQSFTPWESGDYAVIVMSGTCSDTSNCEDIIVDGIIESEAENYVRIYPNPSNGVFDIDLSEESRIVITDAEGKLVYQQQCNSGRNNIDISFADPGVYMIRITGHEINKVSRIVLFE
ncbi:hypothetical protein SDC9_121004 [bioreactor metagenome]|uniref:Secretion system C-terminal sorting domain-containing protein n=1 Tax=bioreactor metagenome TaxID=1076179 RepID=A0A645CAR5_9ZZZZ